MTGVTAGAAATGGPTGRRPGRRPGELIALELPHADAGAGRARPARSPAAWLLALEHDPAVRTPEARRLAELYARRAVRRGGRWVVMIGDHRPRRAFRRLRAVDLAAVACGPSALLSTAEAEALLVDGVTPAALQPLRDPAADCTPTGARRIREALAHLAELGLAAVRQADGARVSAVIAIPNTWT